MKILEVIESCERSYWYQLELKEKIYSRGQITLSGVTALSAGLFFISKYIFDFEKLNDAAAWYCLYVFFIFITSIVLVLCLWKFYCVVSDNSYGYYDVKDWEIRRKKIAEYLKRNNLGEDEAELKSFELVDNYILDVMNIAIENNKKTNFDRTAKLLSSHRYLFLALVLEFISACLYLYVDGIGNNGTNVQKVLIVRDFEQEPLELKVHTVEIGFPDYLRRYLDEQKQAE